jgi:hypothetical protein
MHARASAGGAPEAGAPHGDGAPSTSRDTGPDSETARIRPQPSSPNELRSATAKPVDASPPGFARSTDRSASEQKSPYR